MGIFDKFSTLKSRVDLVEKLGVDPFGVKFDRILNATRGLIGNKEIILAGTNNYLGLTFDQDCIDASIKATRKHGTGTTGSRIANGSTMSMLIWKMLWPSILAWKVPLCFQLGIRQI